VDGIDGAIGHGEKGEVARTSEPKGADL
jgi:hypothetical protein